jgi:hypothetical protein
LGIFSSAATKPQQAHPAVSGSVTPWFLLAKMGLCLTFLGGCTEKGAELSGKVTLDGVPLDDATITFVPMTGTQRQAAWSTVNDGFFQIDAKDGLGTGQFRVEIRALRAVGGKSNQVDPDLVPAKEAVPTRYNSQSELRVNIKPGKNKADFELKTTR